MGYKILAINPGSTSTKIAIYEDEKELFKENIVHSDEELKKYQKVTDKFNMKKENILNFLKNNNFNINSLNGVVARGGLITGIHGGGYHITESMKKILLGDTLTQHASNLGALIADSIAKPLNIPAFIYDAVGSNEMQDIAKVTGFKEFERESFCHVLNTKAMARKAAKIEGKTYQEMNYVLVHLGGGISISAHKNGKIIDVITADDGPFSPERSGGAPLNYILNMCFSGKYTKDEMKKKVAGNGGVKALLGTSNFIEVLEMVKAGDNKAIRVFEAMTYQIAKGIGEMSVVLKGKVDGIILTGGIAYSTELTKKITEYVNFLAPIKILPGENELESLAAGALRILKGEEIAEEY